MNVMHMLEALASSILKMTRFTKNLMALFAILLWITLPKVLSKAGASIFQASGLR